MHASPGRHRVRDAAALAVTLAVTGVVAAALILGASAWRDRTVGDRFDLLRWERLTLAAKLLAVTGAPLRRDPPPDEAIARYFAAPLGAPERRSLENVVEAALAGRIDAVLAAEGVRGRLPSSRSVFPPVAFELAAAPRVLVESPRVVIERRSTELLRPGITAAAAAAIEQAVEARDRGASALVVASGGVAAYPAIVAEGSSYEDTLSAAAHEWMHHYLAFYPLGLSYFDNPAATALNETVADLIGDEVARIAIARWGDPTLPSVAPGAPTGAPTRPPRPATDVNAVLRDLRGEVDGLLATGRIADAEARMEAVREQLAGGGIRIRRINQAYFAWYGTYAARPDSISPVGGQLRELRERAGSLAAFLAIVREATSRADVERRLEAMRGTGRAP